MNSTNSHAAARCAAPVACMQRAVLCAQLRRRCSCCCIRRGRTRRQRWLRGNAVAARPFVQENQSPTLPFLVLHVSAPVRSGAVADARLGLA